MSKIITRSRFFYGHTIGFDNYTLDFSEGAGPELQANLTIGDYTLTEFAAEVGRALTEMGSQNYTVSINRTTRLLTISAPSAFTLKPVSGTRNSISAYPLMGYNVDATGTSLVAPLASGYEYQTQYPVDNYDAEADGQIKEGASVQVSTLGVTQLISFADGARITLNIRLITDEPGVNCQKGFYENLNGRANARDFMKYLITKQKVEFMPDVDTPNVFTKVILESTPENRAGTEFKLKNMRTPEYYETGTLIFRKVLV
jgi:hypothetical protein